MKKMKTIKINFKNFWEGFNKEDNLFTNLLKKDYNVVIDVNPDFMFYSVYPENVISKDIKSKGDMIRKISPMLYKSMRSIYTKINNKQEVADVPQGDFVKILYTTEEVRPNMDECDFAFSPFQDVKDERHFEIPVHLICDWYFKDRLPLNRNIDLDKIKKDKTKFCNFLYSQEFKFRNDFFKKLSKYKTIDSPGRCMNNMKSITSTTPKESRSLDSWAIDKLKFLNNYKFTIACENTEDHPYTTEKLIHPLLVNSIPIYIGNKNVGKYFNTKSFINFSDFNNVKEFIEHIKKVDQDKELYKSYLTQPFFNNKEQYEFSQTERISKRLKEIFR